MNPCRKIALLAIPFLLVAAAATRTPSRKKIPIAPAGAQLLAKIDAMEVRTRWLPYTALGDNWQTGQTTGAPSRGTHCSAFVAAFCLAQNVYILRPPEHGQKLLANAQFAWLMGEPDSPWASVKPQEAKKWKRVDGVRAQTLANRGVIVVACFRNPDATKPGHIALIRPSERSERYILRRGPKVTQAGGHNGSFDLARGFGNHIPKAQKKKPGPWIAKNVVFFTYSVQ